MQAVLQFLTGLKENNTKEWFNDHRKQYDEAKEQMLFLTDILIQEIRRFDEDIPVLSAKDCLFRITSYNVCYTKLLRLAAFFPLIFWKGIMGEFMKILPETLIIVLASSLFVALVLTPPFIARFMKIEDINRKANVKRTLRNAGIILAISIPFYMLGVYWFANLIAMVAILIILNAIALRGLRNNFV